MAVDRGRTSSVASLPCRCPLSEFFRAEEKYDKDHNQLRHRSPEGAPESSMEVRGTSRRPLNHLCASSNRLTDGVHTRHNDCSLLRVICHDDRRPAHGHWGNSCGSVASVNF
jgi:hypothetical protein